MKETANSRMRTTGACLCLLALLLVYAPMASATLMAVTGACCTGEQCPIHGNHHSAPKAPAQASGAPMDCDHADHSSKVNACSMSCCNNLEQIAVHAHIFLLTPLGISTELIPLSAASLAPANVSASQAFAPLAPPPKPLAI